MPEILIDPTIVLKGQQPQVDPLGTVGKLQGVQQGVLNNRLLQQQIGAKEALGRAVTQATDAATGQTDWQKALGYMAQDSAGAFGVPELAGTVLDKQIKELSLQREKLGLSTDQGKVLSNGFLPFIQKFSTPGKDGVVPKPTPNDFAEALSGVLSAMGPGADANVVQRAAALYQHVGDDPAKMIESAKNLAVIGDPTPDRIGMVYGPVTTQDTGAQTLLTQTPTLGGPTAVRTAINKERSPSEKAALVDTYDPATGKMVKRTSGALVGDALPGTAMGAVAQSAPAVGETETAAKGVEAIANWNRQAELAPQQKADLQTIRGLSQQFASGTYADKVGFVKKLATFMGVASPQVRDAAAAQEEAAKLMQQFVNRSTENLGGAGTDAKLESSIKGNPNEFMTREGIMGATALMLGQLDAETARNAAAQKWLAAGGKPGDYQQFVTQFQKLYNPRVFQSVHMSDAQRQKMLQSMSEAERKQFQKDWVFSKKAGWIQ